jgi:hypothetical protein
MKLIQEAVQRLEKLGRPGARMPRLSDAPGDPGPDAAGRDADDDTLRRSVVLDLERLQAEVCSLCRARDRPRPSNSAA